MGGEKKMQPSLIHVPIEKDIVYTPDWLAMDMVMTFWPINNNGLEPCFGDGAIYKYLPKGTKWCEISKGVDFYQWTEPVEWIIGNPPYSNLLAWIRHSFTIAEKIIYLMPLHRVFSSGQFLDDLRAWGGIRHIRHYGTGTDAGFPFGHALAAVYYKRGYSGMTAWTRYIHAEQYEKTFP